MTRWLGVCGAVALATPLALAASAARDVLVVAPWVRAATAGQSVTAAYLELNNRGSDDHVLVAVQSDAARVVELRNVRRDGGGKPRTRRVDQMVLPAHHTVALRPGGAQLRFVGLHHGLDVGDQVDITLIFADGSRTIVFAPVRPAAGVAPDSGG